MQPDLLLPEHFPVAFGRYRLLGLLGEGGMARVFRAELLGDEGFRKPTAVKVIHAAVAARGESLKRSLINEARTGGLLHHPNIVDTYDFGEVAGLPYIAMELVRGVMLDDALAQGAMEPSLMLSAARQICAGLEHAHNLEVDQHVVEVVHRDLKPSNIILSRDGLAKVMDFGIAKATTNAYSTTETGMTKGTPAYMSPEQAAGSELDGRSDLFAFGAILFEMATGERFFQGETLMSLLLSVVKVEEMITDEARMATVDAAVPGLADIVRGCLRLDPADRWPDAHTVEGKLIALERATPRGVGLRSYVRGMMKAGEATPTASGPSKPWPAVSGLPPTRLSLPTEATAAAPVGVQQSRWTDAETRRSVWIPLFTGLGLSLLVAGVLFVWLRPLPEPPEPRPVADAEQSPDGVARDEGTSAPEPVTSAPEPVTFAPEPVTSAPEPATPPPRETAPPSRRRDGPSIGAAPTTSVKGNGKSKEAARLSVVGAAATETDRDSKGANVRFVATLSRATPSTEVVVHFNPPKARWVSRPMRHMGGDRWEINVSFPRRSVGKTYWYVEATPAAGSSVTYGSESRPKTLRLRW